MRQSSSQGFSLSLSFSLHPAAVHDYEQYFVHTDTDKLQLIAVKKVEGQGARERGGREIDWD